MCFLKIKGFILLVHDQNTFKVPAVWPPEYTAHRSGKKEQIGKKQLGVMFVRREAQNLDLHHLTSKHRVREAGEGFIEWGIQAVDNSQPGV